MPVIKNQQITENTWNFVADDQPLPPQGDITVSLTRWQQEQSQLQQHAGQIGIRLQSADQLDSLSCNDKIALVELNFPSFGDGRLFSLARLLRDQFAYGGEIRATGNYLADQVYYLHRVGVDAFEFEEDKDVQVALAAVNDFSVCYQPSTN